MWWNDIGVTWSIFSRGKTMRQEFARRPGRTKHRRPWKRSRNALMRSAADFVFLIQHNQLRVTQYHLYKHIFEKIFWLWRFQYLKRLEKKNIASHNLASKRLEALAILHHTPGSRFTLDCRYRVPKWLAEHHLRFLGIDAGFLCHEGSFHCAAWLLLADSWVLLSFCSADFVHSCAPVAPIEPKAISFVQQNGDVHGFCRWVVRRLASSLHVTTPYIERLYDNDG